MGSGAGRVLLLLSVSPRAPHSFLPLMFDTQKSERTESTKLLIYTLCSRSNLQKSFHRSVCVVEGGGGQRGGWGPFLII
jgi:hypothetical protein